MNTRLMTASERRRHYRTLIRRQEGSSLSVPRFCKRNAVSTWTFYQWRKRLAPAKREKPLHAQSSPSMFIPVNVAARADVDAASAKHAEVVLSDGTRVLVPADYSPTGIKAIVDALRGR
jgi:hypothetical protein